jgi:FAD/FMN-containing dehydrogenase
MSSNDPARGLHRRGFLQAATGVLGATALTGVPGMLRAATPPSTDARALNGLRNAIRGNVVERAMPAYETWRQSMIWNRRKFERFHDLIVQAETEDDVVAAVRFASEHALPIKVRSGGHSWSGCYLTDGGMLLDVSRLQRVIIDTDRQLAQVQPGVIGRGLNAQLGRVGLAFPTAHCGMVPLSGFLMGGGLGINSVAWGGMSAFNIEAVDVVTAQGERLHANAEQNSDFYWAARGAGPGLFFAVTNFHLKCYPLPRAITSDIYFFALDDLPSLAEAMDELGPKINPAVELLTVVEPMPADLAGKCGGCSHTALLAAIAYADTDREAKGMLDTIARHPLMRKPLSKIAFRPTPIEVGYEDNEGPFPQRRARADNIYSDDLPAASRIIARHMPEAPSPGDSPVLLWRGTDPYPTDSAYTARGRFYVAGYAQWNDPADDLANGQWLKDLYDELQPLASGFYINEFDRETRGAQTPRCFTPENWRKLQALRQKHDPERVFQSFMGVPA